MRYAIRNADGYVEVRVDASQTVPDGGVEITEEQAGGLLSGEISPGELGVL